jgi:uncharacterized repeat protein (TIGR01451 family)
MRKAHSLWRQAYKAASPDWVDYGEVLTYTVLLQNAGPVDTSAELSDRLPIGLTYVPGSLRCDSGSCAFTDGTITWLGTVPGETAVSVQFQVTAPDDSYPSSWLVNTAAVTDTNQGRAYSFVAETWLGELPERWTLFLPLVRRAP